ncbi:MAG: hypothetical protein L3J12_03070, partial [Spirochaetales bacterium]|nr:hypothetical protein [Spirochaetales bacterium]
MNVRNRILGMDAGSVTVSVVKMDSAGKVLDTCYEYHHGKPAKVLKDILMKIDFSDVAGVARTSGTPDIYRGAVEYDTRVSMIQCAKFFYGKIGSILNVGGEKFALIEFDEDGNYLNLKSNTSCAAGTGGFLDQQAKRLNLAGSGELSERAIANSGEIPKIATRCSVFAKTDIIHSQQEGYSLEEICDGLSLGLAKNIADTLISGNRDNTPMIFTGGVAKNKSVVEHLE